MRLPRPARMRTATVTPLVVLLLPLGAACSHRQPASVVIMIADGCGFNQIAVTDLYVAGQQSAQAYERFPVRLAVQTHSADGAPYEPALAWTDFDYVRQRPTDSAAAATALATGVKTHNGVIGMDVDGQAVTSVLEVAEGLGKASGVVTSVQLSHATPAGFAAHSASRGSYEEIARQMVERSAADVVMGCGHPWYDDDGGRIEAAPEFRYVGGQDLWEALAAGRAGLATDADGNGQLDDAWQLIEAREDFVRLASGAAPRRVFGVARARSTLQCRRSGSADAGPFATPFVQTVPTLAEMTRAALNVLAADPDGFALMVEGGAVDWACHDNRAARLVEEEQGFNEAVQAVIDWTEATGRASATLIVVTGDHETGYLTRAAAGPGDLPWAYQLPPGDGQGSLPALQWNSGSHTNSLLPLFARGPMAEAFGGYAIGEDPHRGPYVDNTAVALVTMAWLRAGSR